MKQILKIFLVIIIAGIALESNAQKSQKLGHIDFAKLYAAMPGQDSIRKQYEEYSMQLQGQFQAMQTEYENKLTDYQNNQATMSSIIKQTKERKFLTSSVESRSSSRQPRKIFRIKKTNSLLLSLKKLGML